jgi:hypothetical protein
VTFFVLLMRSRDWFFQAAQLIVDLLERACRRQEVLAVVRRVEHNGLGVRGPGKARCDRRDKSGEETVAYPSANKTVSAV